ncbi:MAG: tripartite tricarboxylate transporter substrate binding protein [Pusillimonas sp.]
MKQILLWLVLAMAGSTAVAAYPDRPIKVVIPFGPGSSTDLIIRIIAAPVEEALGQPIVIEPKPGANGAISASSVARAAPDGYTLLIGSGSPLAAVPYMQKDPPYDPLKDFAPVTDIGRYTVFLYVNSKLPVKTFQEFIEHVRKHPGEISYATGNASGIVAFAQLNALAGLDMLHVPYKSAPPAMIDLVANRVQTMIDPPSTGINYVKDGRLRALATTLHTRSPLLPDVPTINEAGFPDFTISNWMGLVAPAGTPREIIDKLNKVFRDALESPVIKEQLAAHAFLPNPSSPEDFGLFIAEQKTSYADLLKAAGVERQ